MLTVRSTDERPGLRNRAPRERLPACSSPLRIAPRGPGPAVERTPRAERVTGAPESREPGTAFRPTGLSSAPLALGEIDGHPVR
jgi:hypothetical protein